MKPILDPEESSATNTRTITFTGTRHGLTDAQLLTLVNLLDALGFDVRYLHGNAAGADQRFAEVVDGLGFNIPVAVRADADPLARNRAMVRASNTLIAVPRTLAEERRSGTWQTIRYARKMGVDVWIVWADGTWTREEGAGREVEDVVVPLHLPATISPRGDRTRAAGRAVSTRV